MGNERRRGTAQERYFRSRREIPVNNKSNKTRNLLLMSGGLAAGAVIIGGIFLSRNEENVPHQDFSDVLTFFPELKNKRVRENGSFNAAGRNIDFYNVTDKKFDSNNAAQIYDFVDTLKTTDLLINLESEGKKNNFTLDKHPNKDINIFVVNQNDGIPSYIIGADPMGRGGTGQNDTMTPATTIIRIFDEDKVKLLPTNEFVGRNPEAIANSTIYTEACQALIKVLIDGKPDLISQEMVCNSLDQMYGTKRLGKSYGEYYTSVIGQTRQLGGISIPVVPFSEDSYDRMPVLQTISK